MTEPVSLATARLQCRIDDGVTEEDTLLTGYIAAAREFVEQETGLTLVQRTVVEQHDGFVPQLGTPFLDEITPCTIGRTGWSNARLRAPLWLRSWPIVSLDSVAYTDTDGTPQTLAGTRAVLGTWPAKVHPARDADWPEISPPEGVQVTLTAGYADGAAPTMAIQAMLLLIGHWFRNRETVVAGDRAAAVEVPQAAQDLCDKLRTVRV